MALPANRHLGLDVMRGMTLALMIVVNMSISEPLSYGQLLHAAWHGFTLTDAVFPSFLFVVGAAMAFTLERYQALGTAGFLKKVLTRSALIFICGLIVSNFPFFRLDAAGAVHWQSLGEVRILGVLQRIGLAYAIAAIALNFIGLQASLVLGALVLVAHSWVLMHFGDLTLNGNAALKLDLWAFGPSHLYKGEGVPFDPEGLLGTLPAAVNVLAGCAAATAVRRSAVGWKLVGALALAGVLLICVSAIASPLLPINKKLWTASYVLCTVGLDLVVLSLLLTVLDVMKVRSGVYFFEVLGKNTLALYILAELSMSVAWTVQIGAQPLFMWLYDHLFRWAGDKPGSLLFALVFAQACWTVGWLMDRNRIYIKL